MTKKIVSLLLVCLMACSSTSLISGNFATAGTGAANFLPNCTYTPAQGGFDTGNETTLSSDTAVYITSLFASRYPAGYYYKYNSSCTVAGYKNVLDTLNTYHNKAVIFSKGHRGEYTYSGGANHASLLDCNKNKLIDYEINAKTSSMYAVTFIWHCQTAFPYVKNGNKDTANLAVGMPFSWTNNNSMDKPSTTGTQVYLGWNDKTNLYVYNFTSGTTYLIYDNMFGGTTVGSPQYEWGINANYNYANVAGLFWYYMSQGYTVQNALNTLSTTIYSPNNYNFSNNNNVLKDWLIVYGNWNMQLPSP